MLPPAPTRFSTTTGWPRRSARFVATMRAVRSVPPPGGKPTSMRTGLAGYPDCAWANPAAIAIPRMRLRNANPSANFASVIAILQTVSCKLNSSYGSGVQRGFARRAAKFRRNGMPEAGSSASVVALEGRVGFDDFVHTGPRSLAGRYLRRQWQPVYHSTDLDAGRAKPLRIMGETFALYRGASGEAHLVDGSCPHRGMQLAAGTVEGEAIRCFYHGWKYASDGQCVEQPAEESRFCAKIRIRAYPVREYLGLVFAFLAEGEPPAFPVYPEFEYFEGLLEIDSYQRSCNYFQNLENALDMSHVGYVHGDNVAAFSGIGLGRALTAEESDWGVEYTFRRKDGQIRIN